MSRPSGTRTFSTNLGGAGPAQRVLDGKVGIGTITPGAQLDVRAVATDTVYAISALSENATAIFGRSLNTEFSDEAIGVRGQFMGLNCDVFIGAPIRKPEGLRTARTTGGISFNYSF